MKKDMTGISSSITKKKKKDLERITAEKGISIASLVRTLLYQYLEDRQEEKKAA